jgi:hypothetical protein
VVTPLDVPERVKVADEPITLPEMVYVLGGGVAVKFTPVTDAPLTLTDAVAGENTYPDRLGATTYAPFLSPEN